MILLYMLSVSLGACRVATSPLQDLLLIAKNFEYPDEVKESFRVMGMMREDAATKGCPVWASTADCSHSSHRALPGAP